MDIYMENPHPKYEKEYWPLFNCVCIVALNLLMEKQDKLTPTGMSLSYKALELHFDEKIHKVPGKEIF